ncbi:MAG: [protein-PII] uridylyltransferase, partial [Gammaproteobacteria bacterium]
MNIPPPVSNLTELFDAKDRISLFKQLIQQQDTELKQKFDPDKPVDSLIVERSDFIDRILTACWDHFVGEPTRRPALIAVGGYGRRELFPFSDVDLLILLDDDHPTEHQEQLAGFSRFLWDIGLKPGQSVRTISECVRTAAADQTIMTSLLEARLIVGDLELFEEMKKRTASDRIWPSDEFFAAKIEEQRLRYEKFHDTAYNLEPNIKEGPGGLRDMQVIAWVFKRHYDSSTLKELVKYEFLPESEYLELVSAQQTLWRIRYALHVLTGRGENRLIFDYQRELAELFGFEDRENDQAVEQFMRHYYKTIVGLERLNEMLLQLFNEKFILTPDKSDIIPINFKFNSIGGYLEAVSDDIFVKHPLALFEVFLLIQQITRLKGIRASTIRLIKNNLYLIDDAFRSNKDARRLFMEILRQPRGITHQLRRMNRYGILAAYLPSFANIVARMQYDLFHVYTVDEHTLFVVRNLRRFALDKHNNEFPFCNDIFMLIAKPEVLYLAGLFHDIAKGRGGDHSVLGEEIARQFCIDHEISEHDTKLIAWLVRHHLVMSMTAQRKDISDPEVIHEFASFVGNIERLNYLYLLTVADIRATNPSLWNSWKDSLLKELYISTHTALRRGLENPIGQSVRINEVKAETRHELAKLGVPETTVEKAWQHINNDYFLRYSSDEAVWHTIGIASCSEEEFPLVLLRPQTQRGSAEIFIYTKDVGPIFSLCTDILDQLGLTILDARIITTEDQYVLNSFQVLEQSGDPINDLRKETHICSALRERLLNQNVKGQSNIRRQSRQAKHFPI